MAGSGRTSIDELRKELGEDGIKRLAECKDDKERMALLEGHGIELSDEDLEQIAGGGVFDLLREFAQWTWEEISG